MKLRVNNGKGGGFVFGIPVDKNGVVTLDEKDTDFVDRVVPLLEKYHAAEPVKMGRPPKADKD